MSTPPESNLALSSWCSVSSEALTHNVGIFRRRLSSGARLGIVVKANAYGHGLLESARTFVSAGADWLIVNSVDEALALRAGELEAPIYICGRVQPARAGDVVAADARCVIYDNELAGALDAAARAAGRVVPVHLKIETGNHRQGLVLRDALALGRLAAALPGLELEGVATHFADIEDTTDHRFAGQQVAAFAAARQAFIEAGLAVPIVHSANSAATILFPETHGDLVRVGLAAYGLWPSPETFATAIQIHAQGGDGFLPELRPALSWRARVAQVKDVPTGAFVGYGRTFRATWPMRVAILPVGYHEGYDRRLSNLAHVLVKGVRAPVRGRVCMNMMMVDVTHIPDVRAGEIATLMGQDGEERVSAEQLAGWMGSINYEVVSRIHPGEPRILT
ncbi:MAG: alanine racemase [Myxococcota bacterium]